MNREFLFLFPFFTFTVRLATTLVIGVNSTHLFDIPRELDSLLEQGWVQVERPSDAYLPSLLMYCPSDILTFCALYDDTGYIAGLQVNIPVDEFTTPLNLTAIGYKVWSAPAHSDIEAQDYWYNNQFFISEENLSKSAEERAAMHQNGESRYDDGVWVPDFDGSITKLSTNITEVIANNFTIQGCVPFMGRHYYYNMSSESSCEDLYPWAELFYDDQLVGTSMNLIGQYPVPEGKRDWLERPVHLLTYLVTPHGPQCLYDYSATVGVLSLHIFYVDNPLTMLNCVVGN